MVEKFFRHSRKKLVSYPRYNEKRIEQYLKCDFLYFQINLNLAKHLYSYVKLF